MNAEAVTPPGGGIRPGFAFGRFLRRGRREEGGAGGEPLLDPGALDDELSVAGDEDDEAGEISAVISFGRPGEDDRAIDQEALGGLAVDPYVMLAEGDDCAPVDATAGGWTVVPGSRVVWGTSVVGEDEEDESIAVVAPERAGDRELLRRIAAEWIAGIPGIELDEVRYGRAGDDDLRVAPAAIERLDAHGYYATLEPGEDRPPGGFADWPLVPGNRIIWTAGISGEAEPIAITGPRYGGSLEVLEEATLQFAAETPGVALIIPPRGRPAAPERPPVPRMAEPAEPRPAGEEAAAVDAGDEAWSSTVTGAAGLAVWREIESAAETRDEGPPPPAPPPGPPPAPPPGPPPAPPPGSPPAPPPGPPPSDAGE